MRLRANWIVVAFVCAGGFACSGAPKGSPDGGSPDGGSPASTNTGPALLGGLDCDPLVPTQCGFPFPSDVYLVDDPAHPGKKHVEFGDKTLPKYYHTRVSKSYYEDHDGWSPGQAPLTHLPGATLTGLPTQDTIALSVTQDSPTILLDTSDGSLVPHWDELDMSTSDDTDRSFMIRPAIRLKDSTRYIVAIRHVKDKNGNALAPTPVFKALRDGSDSSDPSVAPRRALYADIFQKLAAAGVDKSDLQLAWDYTTASKENNTQDMVSMRDQALAALPSDGPAYTITKVTPNPNQYIAKRIEGTFHVPLYLDKPDAGATIVRGADGMPKQNGWADFPFLVQVPNSVATDTEGAAVLEQGHGLLGSRDEGRDGYFAVLANQKKYVTIAVNLIGMADDDESFILKLVNGDIGQFRSSVDRQHQGFVNELVAMRLMMGKFKDDPEMQFNGHSAIDLTKGVYYRGDSQGGILGATYMALTTDVTRGYLGEPGMPYNLLLNRSVDFGEFFVVLQYTYADARDLQLAMGLMQMLWDRTEPDGYAPYITENMLPNTPSHHVLIDCGIGDHQVTPLGAEILARTLKAKNLTPVNREVWGIDDADTVTDGNALTEFDFGLPPAPEADVPPAPAPGQTQDQFDSEDPHDKIRQEQPVMDQTDAFLRTGVAKNYCSGKCDPL